MSSIPPPAACHLVIFGISGDLARRKLLPALYHLEHQGLLHEQCVVTGIGRSELGSDEFEQLLRGALEEFAGGSVDPQSFAMLQQRTRYCALDFSRTESYTSLQQCFADSPRPDIYYFATPSRVYADICAGLHHAQLIHDDSQVVLEKPIGDSLHSSQALNDLVARHFSEDRIYRIDHYLGKETVLNLLVLRFANALFTTNWDYSCIDHVQITVAECVGLQDRWTFFDQAGQLRDMVQNHLLQILCLLAMEPPTDLGADSIRNEKLKVLKALRPISHEGVQTQVVRGQYQGGYIDGKQVPGYKEESPDGHRSQTETFVALKVEIDNWRWSGVPFYLRTGKRLARKQSEINIHFKAQPHNIFRSAYPQLPPNQLTIRLQPDEGIELQMMNKVPGITEISRISRNQLDLSFSESFGTERVVDAYERLLFEAMLQNQSWFLGRDEVETAWAWVDEILLAWKNSGDPPDPYPAGSWGPASAITLIARDGRQWDE